MIKLKDFICVTVLLLCINCTKNTNQDGLARIDNSIKEDTIYAYLRNNNQKFIYENHNNSSIKRTVLVDYSIEKKDFKTNNELLEYYECRVKSEDTLSINIGVNGGLGGYGFNVFYKNKKFKIKPYNYSDQNHAQKKNYNIFYQNLVLDKLQYNVGDSIYGKVDFKIVETDYNKIKSTYIGKGSFIAKISE